ncbi:uncharacterized protein EAF01_004261 [Botrytis porri]|uniref:uncharacterized protein n=1 Tax=Botrytis porri TaxID=87229 RepID=UPI0019013790|nr:uncharacterized protein EAF01_004261 [Botrytis porri]KAF7908506.1 hypothetical protein EAF01_004261 [Botrytis porri]
MHPPSPSRFEIRRIQRSNLRIETMWYSEIVQLNSASDPGDSLENAVARTEEKGKFRVLGTYKATADFIDYQEMSERLLSLDFEFLWEILNDYSKYHEFPLLEEAFVHGEFHTPPNFLSDTLAVFFSLRDVQIMQDSEFRKTVLDSEYTAKEKPDLAWLWSVQQWNPAFDGGNYVSCCERRDCLRS